MIRRILLAGAPATLVGALALPCPTAGQELGLDGLAGASARAWSPLTSIADLPRFAGSGLAGRPVLFPAEPRIGSFWSAGNPAGLSRELPEALAAFGAAARNEEGEFRMPLEPGDRSLRGAWAEGWLPLGERGGLGGTASWSESTLGPGQYALSLEPTRSGPLVVVDSTTSGHRFVTARIEGAAGWRVGRLSLGLAAGIEAVDGVSQEARVSRLNRGVRPGVGAGALWENGDGTVRAGPYVRWLRSAETGQLVAAASPTAVSRIQGYAPPSVAVLPIRSLPYYRRRDADARELGLSAAGETREWSWVVHAAAFEGEQEHWSERAFEPPTDTWTASGLRAGVGLSGAPFQPDLSVHLRAVGSTLSGDAHLASEEAPIFDAEEREVETSFEVRWNPGAAPWSIRAGAGLALDRRDRGDPDPDGLRTVFETRTFRVEFGGEREITPRVRVSGGAAAVSRDPRGRMPGAIHYPPGVRGIAAGEAAYLSTRSRTTLVGVGAEWARSDTAALRFGFTWDRTSPTEGTTSPQFAPEGSFDRWQLAVGIVTR